MVHTESCRVGKFAADNAVRESRFIHGGFERCKRFCRQGDAHVHRFGAVKGPLNGVAALVVLVLLNGQDGFVLEGPLLFIVFGEGSDGVHAFSGDGVVHPGFFVVRVLHVVLVVILEFQRSKR